MNFSRNDLRQKIEEIGKKDIRFIVPMRPIQNYGFIMITSSNDPLEMTECLIDETYYKIADNYKITLKAIDPRFGYDHYYLEDLASLISRNKITIKR